MKSYIKRTAVTASCIVGLCAVGYVAATRVNLNPYRSAGEIVDEFNQVKVYFNGGIYNTSGRNLAADGYNLGIKYQCVEFIKRYYFERFGHEMPEARGNAKDFFDANTPDGAVNTERNLRQFRDGSSTPPRPEDILVLGPGVFNSYGHVAIVSQVTDRYIEIVQQNPGPFATSRENIPLRHTDNRWIVDNHRVLGWLRMPSPVGDRKRIGDESVAGVP